MPTLVTPLEMVAPAVTPAQMLNVGRQQDRFVATSFPRETSRAQQKAMQESLLQCTP